MTQNGYCILVSRDSIHIMLIRERVILYKSTERYSHTQFCIVLVLGKPKQTASEDSKWEDLEIHGYWMK